MTTPLDAELPPIDDEAQQFLHYNPNTADLVEWVRNYARAAIAMDRAARQPAPPVDVSLSALREGLRELRQAAESAILQDDPALPLVEAPAARAQQRSLDADAARLDFLERWVQHAKARGFNWDTFTFDVKRTVREQLGEQMAAGLIELRKVQPPQGGSV